MLDRTFLLVELISAKRIDRVLFLTLNATRNALIRVGFWLGSLLVSVLVFTLFFGAGRAVIFIYRTTMILAFPVWCLCLPLIVKLRDTEGTRIWIILGVGAVVGPFALALWCLVLQLRGGDAYTIWHGDPLAPSTAMFMLFASFVGLLTSSMYAITLKLIYRQVRGSATISLRYEYGRALRDAHISESRYGAPGTRRGNPPLMKA
jgi:hypothetical protein